MSAQPSRNIFAVVSAIIMAAILISGTLYITLGQSPKTVTSISTATTTITITQSSSAAQSLIQPTSSSGSIQISNANGTEFETFVYDEWNSSTPNTSTINGVTFTLWTNTTITNSAGSCYGAPNGYGGYVIKFSDGTSQAMTTCTVGFNPPTSLRLTTHTNPQAGLLIFPRTGAVYFLVSS